jgi:SAM-dependent methyltransferase
VSVLISLIGVLAQAVHWFDYKKLFPELARVLKPGGTVALWNYTELRFGGRPSLDPLLSRYSHDENSLGPHWEQPGEHLLLVSETERTEDDE